MNWLLDSKQSGNNVPDGIVNSISLEFVVFLLITFIVGFLIGFGVRHLIQTYKEAPEDKDNPKSE